MGLLAKTIAQQALMHASKAVTQMSAKTYAERTANVQGNAAVAHAAQSVVATVVANIDARRTSARTFVETLTSASIPAPARTAVCVVERAPHANIPVTETYANLNAAEALTVNSSARGKRVGQIAPMQRPAHSHVWRDIVKSVAAI